MHEKKGFSKRTEEFLNGKGFYIVLFVCIAVIGVSAWLLLFSEYSPLNLGDDGDYLDVMAGTEDVSAPIDLREDENTMPSEDSAEQDGTAPENAVPEANTQSTDESGSDTLKVEDNSEPAETQEAEPEQQTDAEQTAKDISYIWPLYGDVATGYSPASLVFDKTMGDWRTHDGVDIAAQLGTKVMTVADGTVTKVYSDEMYGTTVVINHGAGVVSTYSNLAATPTVSEGDAVTMGSVIGSVGDTALAETSEVYHLHFAMTVDGVSADPTDYLPRR